MAATKSNSYLDKIAAERLVKIREGRKQNFADLPILDLIPALSPRFHRPDHLEPIAVYLDAIFEGPQFFTFSAPPRHGKSELIFHFIAKFIARFPHLNVAYTTFTATLAEKRSIQIRELCRRIGVEFDKTFSSRSDWKTAQGGGLMARGTGGPLTGEGVNLLVVDDPYRDRGEAESLTQRENLMDWWTGVAMTRIEPGGSVVVFHCVAKNEPVLMADGTWRAVQEVRAGEYVKALDGDTFVDRKVLGSKPSGRDSILTVRTQRKSLRVNDRHPFLLKSGVWRKSGELAVGDEVVVCNQGVGTETCDPEFAWFMGFMMGDGWVTTWERTNKKPSGKSYKTRSWCVCAAKSEYPELNERVQAAFERFFGRRPKETKFGYYRLDSNSSGRLLLQLGLGGGAHGKRIAEWVFRLTPELKEKYLRGYIDADGNHMKDTIEMYKVASVSESLMEDARLLAVSAGLDCSRMRVSQQMVHAPHSAAPKLSTIYSVHINFAKRAMDTEVITAITHDGEDEVFDLMVDGQENFVAQGFVVHNTRWHPEDIIGVLMNESDWPHVNLKALGEDGTALWPARYTVADLQARRNVVGEYDWASMYQGEPRPRGGAVFSGTYLYTDEQFAKLKADRKIAKYVIGIDCAYTSKTHSDYSAAVVIAIDTDKNNYVVDVRRLQCESPKFAQVLKELRLTYDHPQVFWYTGGTEKAVVDTFRDTYGIPIKAVPARDDKFARALASASAWNAGRILIPKDEKPWKGTFLAEVLTFSGLGDKHDDQVDALAAAFIPTAGKQVTRGMIKKRFF